MEDIGFEDATANMASDVYQDAWFAELLFWRPSKLSDKDMRLHFSDYDGKWSSQTQAAVQRFRADGLDLNENWALSSPTWSCPACRRSKPDIFRLSPRNILLAKLECHHDHLREHLWKRVDALFGKDWRETAPAGARLLCEPIRDLATRFSTALICSECNAADGTAKAKLRVEIDPRFTFTVDEIGRFITTNPHAEHGIDIEKARQIWTEQKPAFEYRLQLIDHLLTDALSGRLTRDVSGWAGARHVETALQAAPILSRAFFRGFSDSAKSGLLHGFHQEFLNRSRSQDSARLTPLIKKSPERARASTDEEFAAYTDPNSSKWREAPDTWCCPLCAREKRAIMRLSNKKRWSGGIREFFVCDEEMDPEALANRRILFPKFPNDRFVGGTSTTLICSDCADVPTKLGQHDPSFGRPLMQPSDIQASIAAVMPNAPHDIDFATAAQRATANASLEAAIAAFNCYRAKASDFATRYMLWRRAGQAHQTVMAELDEDVRVIHSIEDAAECRRLAEWLIHTGSQFKG